MNGLVLALATLLAMPVQAQLQSGNLYGAVADDQGSPLPGVTVALAGTGAQSQNRFREILGARQWQGSGG